MLQAHDVVTHEVYRGGDRGGGAREVGELRNPTPPPVLPAYVNGADGDMDPDEEEALTQVVPYIPMFQPLNE